MNLPDKDCPIRIYLSTSSEPPTQIIMRDELLSPRQYGMSIRKKHNKKKK